MAMRRRSRAGPEQAKSRRRKTKTQKHRGGLKTAGPRNSSAADVAQLTRERDEALEREKATAEVLRVISSSPGELEPVFQAMLANAVRICDAKFGVLFRHDNETFNPAALFGVPPALADFIWQRGSFQPVTDTVLDRVRRTKQVSHT